MREAVIALDLGTGSCKGALYDQNGARLELARHEYEVHHPAPHFSEQRPLDYLDGAREVCRELSARARDASIRIAAVGLSTQTPTLLFCNEAGDALGSAILWQDARASAEAEWLLEAAPESERRKWFGVHLPIGAASTPAKLLWMKRNAPEIWRATRWIMQPKDYVAWRMTGALAVDHWCAKGVAHLETGEVDPGYLELLGKTVSPCPPVLSPSEFVGRVAGAEWHLPEGIPVTVGWSDAMAGILATGSLHRRRGFVLSGTSEIIGCSSTGCEQAPGMFHVPASVFPLKGFGLHYGPTECGGSTLAWLAQLFGKTPEQVLALLDERRGAGPSPVLFRPYLNGERTPYWDHRLCAGFEGLRAEHGAAEIACAVLEGVALHERLVLEIAESGAPGKEVALAGGGTRDQRWNQLRADVLQRTLLVSRDPESSLRGAAMLAWGNCENPSNSWFAADELHPDRRCAVQFSEKLDRFRLRKV